MWSFLDLITSLFIAQDAANLSRQGANDRPAQKHWRRLAVILLLILAIASVGFALLELGLY